MKMVKRAFVAAMAPGWSLEPRDAAWSDLT